MTKNFDLINAIEKSAPSIMPTDPGCPGMKYLSVEIGVQAIIHIVGSESLIYIVNPDDGREPYIVIRNPQSDAMMTTKLHRCRRYAKELNDDDPEK